MLRDRLALTKIGTTYKTDETPIVSRIAIACSLRGRPIIVGRLN